MNRQNQNRRGLLLFALAFGVVGTAQADPALRVRGIRVSESEGDTSIAIQSSGKPTFTTWKLEQPARVVVEVSGARLGDVNVPMDVGTRAVGTVSANVTDDSAVGPRTRIVLTLRQPADYRVEAKGNDIFLKVVPHERLAAKTSPGQGQDGSLGQWKHKVSEQEKAIAAAKAEAVEKDKAAQAQIEKETQARSEAQSQTQRATEEKIEAERKAQLAAREKIEAERKAQLAAREKIEAEQKAQLAAREKIEAERKAQLAAREKIEAEQKAQSAAKAKAEALALAEAAARAKAEAEETAKLATKAKADAEERARISAREKLEAESKVKDALAAKNAALARAEAEAEARRVAERLAQENAKQVKQVAVDARAQAEAKQRAQQREAEVSHQSAAQAKVETEQLRKALAEAQKEAEKARALAAKVSEEKSREQRSREQSEESLRLAKLDAETAWQRAKRAEGEIQAMRRKESEQSETLRNTVAEVEARKKSLAAVAKAQEEQQASLAESSKRLARRESELNASLADLSAKDAAARQARAKRDALSEGASEKRRQQAVELVAKAEQQQRAAEEAVALSRRERDLAVQSRKNEEEKRAEQTQLRTQEERRLAEAVAQRKAEERKLEESRAERERLEGERTKLLAEKEALEKANAALTKESERIVATRTKLEKAPPRAEPQVHVTPSKTESIPASRDAVTAAATPARSRSITIRGRSLIRNVEFVDEPQRSSVIIDVDESAEFKLERLGGRQVSLRIEHADLPAELERNLDATEYLGPVKVVSSYRDPSSRGTVRIVVDLAEEVPYRVRQDGRRIFWDFQKVSGKSSPTLPAHILPPPSARSLPFPKFAGILVPVTPALWQGQAAAAPAPARPTLVGKKRYVGRRIDLDFKGADIHNILRLLADVGGVNIVVADEVRGDITIKMRDVPWDQALDVVLRAKGLGSVREGNLLRVAPLGVLEKELEAEIARQKQIADVLPTETRLIGVSYAEAGQMVDKARDLLSPRGKISVDSRTNNLIVSDVAKNLQLIEDLVRNLDTQTSQVVIEARVVEANSNFARQMGIQWGGSGFADSTHGNPTGLVFPYNIGIGGGADDSAAPLGGLVPSPRTGAGTTGSPNFLVNMPAAAGLGTGSAIGLTMGSVAGAFNLNLRLSAMESQGQVRILSSPRITTMDNVEATISQGVSIPVSVVSAAGAQTQFVDAKLLLGVKPHVTNEGTISLDVHITRNEPDFVNTGARGDPSIQKKEAKTVMLVRDGDTAVIGGIYTRNTGLSNQKVPFFADIPVLGWFFRNKRENDNRSEFLVFITPRIVNRARALGQ